MIGLESVCHLASFLFQDFKGFRTLVPQYFKNFCFLVRILVCSCKHILSGLTFDKKVSLKSVTSQNFVEPCESPKKNLSLENGNYLETLQLVTK